MNRFKLFYKFTLVVILYIAGFNNSVAQFIGGEPKIDVKTFLSTDGVVPGDDIKLAVELNIKEGWHINSNKPLDEFLIPTKISIVNFDKSFFNLEKVVYPPAQEVTLSFSDKPLSAWEGIVYAGAAVKAPSDMQPGSYKFIVEVEYQSCNNSTCLPPMTIKDTVTVNVTNDKETISETNREIFKNIQGDLTTSVSQVKKDKDSITSALESNGLFIGLLLVFLGGLALNLTPCVYPLIPITIGYFGGQSEGSTKKLFMMGLLFVVGLALTYSIIGVITALSGAIFGALLQNTYVILFIVLIFIVLSLSMFGVYEFKLPDALVAKAGGAKGGYYGAFFMGLTMGIVAAPCIGPFVLGLVTYVAAKADPFFGFLMFFVLALGLGFPYLFLAMFSGKIKNLPRAGEWMDGVKHIFGFILIGMALYFLLPLLPKEISGYVLPVFMIITAIYLLFIEKLANNIIGFRLFKIAFSIILIGVAVYSLMPGSENSINWKKYSDNSLNATVEGKRGTIIDFYADWCIPCKELDALTFSDPAVITEAENFETYKADMTKSLAPEVELLRNKFKIVGVPTVLILDSKGNEVERITGFLPPDEFLKILTSVK